ncbi:MAG: ParB N-terminal domain-containing protein [Candidatus Hadarchaeota archaeon]
MPLEFKEHGFGCRLEVLPVEELKIHEEIVPELLKRLIGDMKSSGLVKDPIIADARTRVVLDGMHRVAASKELGLKYLPVCSVDYSDPRIRIGCWYRVARSEGIQFGEIVRMLKLILALLGLDVRQSSMEDAKNTVDGRRATAALVTTDDCHLIAAKKTEIHESYAWIKRVERVLKEEGFSLSYEKEKDAIATLDKTSVVMLVPSVTKEEVVEVALSGKVFAHKTTRHVLPVRPVNMNIPVAWLLGGGLQDVDKKFVGKLSKQKVKHLPGGSAFGERKYEEELLVFEEKQ